MNKHYENIAEDFNKVWKFSDEYKIWAVERIGHYLDLKRNDIFVDVGGGTGTFTNMIDKKFELKKAYCVEPESRMCDLAKEHPNIETICSDAFDFLNNLQLKYNKILFKEVIHHIKDRKKLWHDIYHTIEDDGRILIYTRPRNNKFPLFQKAKKEFYKNQPSYDEMILELEESKFKTSVSLKSFTFELSKDEWYSMLKSRFMSDLSVFTDAEITQGIKELEKENSSDIFIIEDEIVFITAYK
ncbi:MAG: class I SAM-dependent methyltransferase [Candidatus Gracilibacteria bacterium]